MFLDANGLEAVVRRLDEEGVVRDLGGGFNVARHKEEVVEDGCVFAAIRRLL